MKKWKEKKKEWKIVKRNKKERMKRVKRKKKKEWKIKQKNERV